MNLTLKSWTRMKYTQQVFELAYALSVNNQGGLESISIRTGPALVMRGKYRPDPILWKIGFNFDGAARLFTVPGLL